MILNFTPHHTLCIKSQCPKSKKQNNLFFFKETREYWLQRCSGRSLTWPTSSYNPKPTRWSPPPKLSFWLHPSGSGLTPPPSSAVSRTWNKPCKENKQRSQALNLYKCPSFISTTEHHHDFIFTLEKNTTEQKHRERTHSRVGKKVWVHHRNAFWLDNQYHTNVGFVIDTPTETIRSTLNAESRDRALSLTTHQSNASYSKMPPKL